MPKPPLAQIEFAKRHLVTELSTFTASSAMFRLESLLDDIRTAEELLQPHLNKRFAPAFFEFTAYYRVGFVTCLEWHAKSRLYDMFRFNPKAINSDDIRRAVSNEKLTHMVAEGLTIPHLLAGSSGISSKEDYVNAIFRVFEAIGAPYVALSDILNLKEDDVSLGELLEQLFVDRNDLVHEIGIQTIGHPNIRDFDSFADVLVKGERLLRMIQDIERTITTHAVPTFPNKLGEDGYPINEEELLHKMIDATEAKIGEVIGTDQVVGELSCEDWREAMSRSGEYLTAELQLIDSLILPGSRYYDVRPFLKSSLLKHRLQFLNLLSDQLLGHPEEGHIVGS